jgi:tRNA-binding EMAP/Myf-like protein
VSSRGIVVGRILNVRIHPNGDHIRLADVNLGDGEPRQIVFGGNKNPQPGDLVAVAPPGSRLFSGVKIRRRHFRGEWSYGMLCSTTELGWVMEGPDEIAILCAGKVPGTSLDYVDFPYNWLNETSRPTPVDILQTHSSSPPLLENEAATENGASRNTGAMGVPC